ncbi:MAG: hypothetical protein KA243_12330 [Candidatus Aminicenantes bacterium]|nr:hypothetical protein [Candidatus Aminicenantes bacterium]
MIYQVLSPDNPICQGDIFVRLPRVDLSLDRFIILTEDAERAASWAEVAPTDEAIKAVVSVRSVAAIVASQDCDAQHERDITLCEIRSFLEVCGLPEPTTPKAWISLITRQSRLNLKWFYLPPDDSIGFSQRMAVDFRVTLRVPRKDLEGLIHLRKGRLNARAYDHFRERLSEFFRRYSYDEWYPFNPEELASYREKYPEALPFSWQEKEPKSVEEER